jgi:hypothetical protein
VPLGFVAPFPGVGEADAGGKRQGEGAHHQETMPTTAWPCVALACLELHRYALCRTMGYLLAYFTGSMDQELLLRIAHVGTGSRLLTYDDREAA